MKAKDIGPNKQKKVNAISLNKCINVYHKTSFSKLPPQIWAHPLYIYSLSFLKTVLKYIHLEILICRKFSFIFIRNIEIQAHVYSIKKNKPKQSTLKHKTPCSVWKCILCFGDESWWQWEHFLCSLRKVYCCFKTSYLIPWCFGREAGTRKRKVQTNVSRLSNRYFKDWHHGTDF